MLPHFFMYHIDYSASIVFSAAMLAANSSHFFFASGSLRISASISSVSRYSATASIVQLAFNPAFSTNARMSDNCTLKNSFLGLTFYCNLNNSIQLVLKEVVSLLDIF